MADDYEEMFRAALASELHCSWDDIDDLGSFAPLIEEMRRLASENERLRGRKESDGG